MLNYGRPGLDNDRLHRRIGMYFSRKPLAEVVTLALRDIQAPAFYVTCNLNHLRVLQSNSEFREAYRKAALVTLDSRPLQMALRLRFKESVPLVTGADLFAELFGRLRPSKDRPFFVSSTQETGSKLRQRLIGRGFAPEAVTFYSPPVGFQDNAALSQRMISQIQAHHTTHLFIGVGAPKSELWVAQHIGSLPPAHILCIGAALDFTAGTKVRAPTWVGRFGLEWLHRLLSEPRRLLPRYAGDVAVLAKVLAGQPLVRVSPPREQCDVGLTPVDQV